MIYDFTRNSVYVTGTTFAANQYADAASSSKFKRSTCFVGELPLADVEKWKLADPPMPPFSNNDFVVPDSLDDRESMACHMIYYDDESRSDDVLFVGGVVEPDSIARNGKIQAFANLYERSRTEPDWALTAKSVEIQNPTQPNVEEATIRWPVAMTSGVRSGIDSVMVIFISSADGLMTEKYIENGDANNMNNSKNVLLPPGLDGGSQSKYGVPKRGSAYYMSYHIYEVTANREFVFTRGRDLLVPTSVVEGSGMYPTGILNLNPNGLDVTFVGHIMGEAPPETKMKNGMDNDGNVRTDDIDGFAMPLKLADGHHHHNLRFSSLEMNPPLDDYLHGQCTDPFTDNTIDAFYVIGGTYGTMPAASRQEKITTNILNDSNDSTNGNTINKLSAWISKISVKDSAVVWTTQLYAIKDNKSFDGGMTEAFGCHVIDDDPSKMYVGGTVYNGGTMDTQHESAGSDDIWVAQLSTVDGALTWIRQIGSAGNDRMARTNGVESDMDGNAIIYGETSGELYRKRKGEAPPANDGTTTDIFIATLLKTNGQSDRTIEEHRQFKKKRGGVIGSLTVVILLTMLVVGLWFWYKFRGTRRRGTSRPADIKGVMSDNIMPSYSDEQSDGESNGSVSHPPISAFKEKPEQKFV